MRLTTSAWQRFQPLTSTGKRRRIVALLLASGVLVSALSARSVAELERSRQQQRIATTTAIVTGRVERLTAEAVDALKSIRPLWGLRPGATDREFQRYVRAGLADEQAAATTYAGLSDIAFVRALDAREARRFARAVRAERPRRHRFRPAGDRPHYVVDFHTSGTIVGTDLYPLRDRRVTLEAARDRATAVASSWYTPVSDLELPETRRRKMTLVAVPVYSGTAPPATRAARRERLRGWLVAALFANEVVERVAADLPVGVALRAASTAGNPADASAHTAADATANTPADTAADANANANANANAGTAAEPAAVTADDAPPLATAGREIATPRRLTIDVLDRSWTLDIGTEDRATAGSLLGAAAVFALGLALTLLLTTMFWLASRLGARSESRATTATAQLRDRDEHLRLIAERVPVGIADLGADGRIRWANPQLARLTGTSVDQLVGLPWSSLVHPDDRESLVAAHAGAVSAGRPCTVRYRLPPEAGAGWIETSCAPQLDDDGTVSRVVAVISDVSAVVDFERQLRTARDRAVEASRMKSEFLANMSHEIRTPLNGVIGMADALDHTELTDRQHAKVAVLRNAALQLRDLLGDLLDLSTIDAGRLELDESEFDLAEAVRGLVAAVAPDAFAKGLRVHADVDDLPPRVRGARVRVRQVLDKLLRNAVKFTAEGEIELTARVVERGDEHVRVRFDVSDTGIGISEAAIGRIFDPFTQADASSTRAHDGPGLGLAISRRLVEMMGGRLDVESTADQGSRFTFDVAFAVVPPDDPPDDLPDPASGSSTADTAAASHDPTASGPRLLVIEDNPINQEVARELLGTMGYEVDVAPDGSAGVDAVRGTRYAAVLMDCQMPVMDGYEATARIREDEADTGRHTPIIAMTASAMVGDRQRCLAAGMDDYVSKPVSADVLADTLARWVGRSAPATAGRAAAADDDEAPVVDWKILHRLSVVPGLLERSRATYLANGAQEVVALRALHVAQDHDALRAAAHKLKGASLTLGATRLGQRLQQLEHAATDEPDAIDELLAAVESAFAEVREALEASETATT